ncbi:hypothetical protein HELRODRAFT_178529 [Helobdella robusta]|uniref:Uncharacterized protein n=1 Tax=Helobdella robusta TaxID=6412 RepID=T1FDB5_HELRO|nr:hypothetical protein HELRODRAFT_178529 [Helobdella robusta]ESN97080.1 hypothetical protein HELRODRAFT_178529 [Helobdella robusta]
MEHKTAQDFRTYLEENFSECRLPLLNGHIYYTFLKSKNLKTNKSSAIMTHRELQSRSFVFKAKEWTLLTKIKMVNSTISNFKLNFTKYWTKVVNFLNSPFNIQPMKVEDCLLLENGITDSENNTKVNVEKAEVNSGKNNISSEDIKIDDMLTSGHVLRTIEDGDGSKLRTYGQECIYCLSRKNSLKSSRKRTKFFKNAYKECKEKNSELKRTNLILQRSSMRGKLSAHLWKCRYRKLKQEKASKSDIEKKFFNTIKALNISNSQLRRHNKRVKEEWDKQLKLKNVVVAELLLKITDLEKKISTQVAIP